MSQNNPLVIIGGSGSAGHYLMQRLASAGMKAHVISRRFHVVDVPSGFTKGQADLTSGVWTATAGACVISFAPLWLLAESLPRFVGIKSIIAIGSTSRYSKINSSDAHERSVATLLISAEETIQLWAEKNNVSWTILRPTLIYDGQRDQNITRMARFIRRWHFLPLAAPAEGLRQPIHADDVAKAAFNCLNNPAAANKAFNIAGGEILSYHAMATQIFFALIQKPRFVMLPTRLLQRAFHVAAWFGFVQESNFGAAIFQRMNENLVFDIAEGLNILDYQPRLFKPEFPNLL